MTVMSLPFALVRSSAVPDVERFFGVGGASAARRQQPGDIPSIGRPAAAGDSSSPQPDDVPAPHVTEAIEAAFRAGTESGLAAAYEAHGPLIHTLCARAHPVAAADLTQEVFLAAWRGRDGFDPRRGPLAAWLVGIAKNKIVDAYRTDGRRVPLDHRADDDHVERVPDGREPLDRLADRLLVTQALATLPERPRSIVELAYFEDLTQQEIADRTGIPLGTVKSDIRRGLARLRRYLEAAS